MHAARLEIRLLALPMREPFAAAHGTSARREITVVHLETDEGTGWGECAALAEPTYTAEYAAGAFDVIHDRLAPLLLDSHDVTSATIGRVLAPVRANPMAKAALEMAVLDIELRTERRSLASWLSAGAAAGGGGGDGDGGGVDRVPAGAAVGLGEPSVVADRVEQLAADGFGRVKLKIMPGHDRAVVDAVRRRCPDLDLQLDANGSYAWAAADRAIDLLAELAADHAIGALEQPFDPALIDHAARLVAELDRRGLATVVVADEAARSDRHVRRLHRAGALSGVSVKPSRLGGLQAAVGVQRTAVGRGIALTAGGMVETGLGRHALAAMAALPGFTLTGDVSPASRWLAADPWPDLVMADGHIVVPHLPGVAPDPDLDVIDAHTTRSARCLPGRSRAQ